MRLFDEISVTNKTFLISFGLLLIVLHCECLRCRTDDGPAEEEIKRVVRTCMKKIGDQKTDDANYEDEDYDDENNNNGYKSRDSNKNDYGTNYNRNNNEARSRFKRFPAEDRANEWNNKEEDHHNRSCMMNCFFQEMKMTNNEGYPDKNKVIHIVAKDIRDRELKEFYEDSIQECFHILEMEQRKDKCIFTKNLLICLTDRVKANCDDYHGETVIF